MTRPLDAFWPSHASEPTHEKNHDVADALGIHVMQAYGHIRAFRTRYPQEAPTGRLRGGDDQVERLALWDGPRGALAAAFRKFGIVDVDAAGVLVAHGHEEFVGAVLEKRQRARSNGAERQQRFREKGTRTHEGEGGTQGDASPNASPNASRDASSPLTYLLSPSSDLGSAERGSGGEAEAPAPPPATPPAIPARPPQTARQAPIDPPDGQGDAPTTAERAEARERNHVVGAGWREKQEKTAKAEAIYARPQTVEAMLAYRADPQGPTLGEQWAQRFKQLDGKNGRPTVAEKVTVLWEASLSKRWGINGALVIAWFVSRLGEDANKFRVAWEKDGGTTTQGQHPLWATWRRLRDTPGEDPPPFDEWLIKREEAKPRTSGSPSPSASTPPKQSTPAPPSTSTPPEVSEEEAAAARARFLSLAKPVGAKPAPPPRRARLNPDATTLNTMLERELGDGADT